MKHISKILAIIIALVMAITCTSLVAFAVNAQPEAKGVERDLENTVMYQNYSTKAIGIQCSFVEENWYPYVNLSYTFTCSGTGTLRVGINAIREDGSKNEQVTLTVYKVGLLGSLSKVYSTTVKADGNLQVQHITSKKLDTGKKYKVEESSSAMQKMVVAGYVGTE